VKSFSEDAGWRESLQTAVLVDVIKNKLSLDGIFIDLLFFRRYLVGANVELVHLWRQDFREFSHHPEV
jgi:hypothetical protein